MPSVDENRALWEAESSWRDRGDDWSTAWGGAEAQWYACLYPRLRRYLPAATVLEIGPGQGRWTQFLIAECDRLIGVDLSPSCVTACRTRFAHVPHAEFHSNDGRSLDVVASGSVDLVFSFDSLVHVESDVLTDYLAAIADKLSSDGVAFLHHSNLGEYRKDFARFERVPAVLRSRLVAKGIIDHSHLRGSTVTAAWLAGACAEVGLACVGQELINWGSKRLIDCISVVTRRDSPRSGANHVVRNRYFMAEAESIRLASQLHATP